MARIINSEEVEKFAPTTGAGYFSLADNGDYARVRLLYNSHKDFYPYTAHKVKIGMYDKYVDCLRPHYDSPYSECPLCNSGNKVVPRYYIPMFIEQQSDDKDGTKSGTVVLWDRGYSIKSAIDNVIAECGNEPPVSCVVTITRLGAAGDLNTKYEMHADVSDGTTIDNLIDEFGIEIPEPEGTSLLTKTFEEMENYVNTGSFDGRPSAPANESFPRRNPGAFNGNGATTPNNNMNANANNTFTRRRPVSSNNIPL